MPLLDPRRPPVSKRASWEGFHGLWPDIIVQELAPRLLYYFVAVCHAFILATTATRSIDQAWMPESRLLQQIGQPLPSLPVWLFRKLSPSLLTWKRATRRSCRVLRIP